MARLPAKLIGVPLALTLTALAALWTVHLCIEPQGIEPQGIEPQGIEPQGIEPGRMRVAGGPAVTTLPPQHAASLPKIGPFPSDRLHPPSDATTQASGTGFFATPYAVITAAHVVSDCRAIGLVSQHLPATAARLVAVDAENDIAVLLADAAAPAHLDIANAAAPPTRVLVYGFPATARRDVPNTTWASLVNHSFGPASALENDPATLLWMQNRDIAQGYSGGPILNPATGQVLGIVRALIDPARAAQAYGIAMPDLSIGPGAAPLRAMLAHESIRPGTATDSEDDIFTRARKAIVHVYCWQ